MQRVEAGYANYVNPFGGQQYDVSLLPEDVICFVFWSKNFAPFLHNLATLDQKGYLFYVNFTITGLPTCFEPNVIPTDHAINTLQHLAQQYSPYHINWRYDPIILSDITDEAYHLHRFEELARTLHGATHRCYISFVSRYGKVQRRFRAFEAREQINIHDPDIATQQALANQLAAIATKYGMSMYACCNDDLLSPTIHKAHCIDRDVIYHLTNTHSHKLKTKPTRKGCGCTESVDIGTYETCPHGCIYCYANTNQQKATLAYQQHSPIRSRL